MVSQSVKDKNVPQIELMFRFLGGISVVLSAVEGGGWTEMEHCCDSIHHIFHLLPS